MLVTASQMHRSTFSYSLTRSYPYKWYTWIVVLGGIAATALFSVINVAANGYDSSTIYVTNPNEIEHPDNLQWYQKRPWSFATKVNTFCQDQTFVLGTEVRTNGSLRGYKIAQITSTVNNQSTQARSFTYHNNNLRDCEITKLVGSSRKDFNQTDAGIGTDAPNYMVAVAANCTIYNSGTTTVLTLVSTYDKFLDVYGDFSYLFTDPYSQPALWWAQYMFQSLIYLGRLTTFHFSLRNEAEDQSTKDLYISIMGNNGSLVAEVKNSTRMRTVDQWISTFGIDMLPYYERPPNGYWHVQDDKAASIIAMDFIIKLLYSHTMTDLGQSVPSNLFASPLGMVKFFNATNEVAESPKLTPAEANGIYAIPVYRIPGLPNRSDPYNFTESDVRNTSNFYNYIGTGVPRVNPAVINAQYICQIPKLKPIGSVAVSVIIGDLVMLQALWMFFNWAVKFILEQSKPDANFCDGCTMMMTMARNGDRPVATASTIDLEEPKLKEPADETRLNTSVYTSDNSKMSRWKYKLDRTRKMVKPTDNSHFFMSNGKTKIRTDLSR